MSAKQMGPNVAQAYKDATDNLIYLKRDQFQVTYYVWLMLAALYILSNGRSPGEKLFLQGGAALVGFLSVSLVWNFHASMEKFRSRLNSIYQNYFNDDEQRILQLEGANPHCFVTFLLTLSCVFASFFTIYLMK